jgi:hypothetical protein
MQDSTVYDLGEVALDPTPSSPARGAQAPARSPARPAASAPIVGATRFAPAPALAPARFDYAGSAALIVPGLGHLLQRRWSSGLLLLSALSLIGVLGWAVLETLDRITGTLALLGLPTEFAVWSLAGLFVAAATTHLASVAGGHGDVGGSALHPLVPGLASALIPGWGQLLNGDVKRAVGFVFGLWCIGAVWLLAAPATGTLLDAQGLYVPERLSLLTSAGVRWTLPAVIWAVAIYDATSSASSRR